jgi:HEAT repeat protein
MATIDEMIARLGREKGADEAIAGLVELRLEALPAVLECLKNPRGRQGLDDPLEVLVRMGPDIAPHLIEAGKQDRALYGPIAWTLGQLRSAEAVDFLREVLRSDKEWERWSAAKALDRIGVSRYPTGG